MILSAIATEPDVAEVFFLVALIIFAIATVLSITLTKDIVSVLASAGMTALSFGFLLL